MHKYKTSYILQGEKNEDCKTISQTTNLHIDPKEGLVKALLYLDPVEDDNG